MYDVITRDFTFEGFERPLTSADRGAGPWRHAVLGAAPPLVQSQDGEMALELTATNEQQYAVLFNGNVLGIDIDDLVSVEFWARKNASTYAAQVQAVFGVAGVHNNDPDAIAASAWFKVHGNDTLVVETDDGVINNDDAATGLSLFGQSSAGSYRRYMIDFAGGVQTVSPPGKSKGGKSAIRFFAENAQGILKPVAQNTLFDMSNYTGRLQLYATILKSASTAVGGLYFKRIRYTYRIPL